MKKNYCTIKYGSHSKVMAIVIALLLACVSILAVATSAFMPKVSRAAPNMKVAGDSFTAYSEQYTKDMNDKVLAENPLPEVTLDSLFEQIYVNTINNIINPGIITVALNGTNAKYTNATYNYEVTISSAEELAKFSYLCIGLPFGQLVSVTEPNTEVATFFRGANVRLANHIDFSYGNGRFTTNSNGGGTIKNISNSTAVAGTPGSVGVYVGQGTSTPFLPINEFSGVFNGGGYDIANLRIVRNRNPLYGGAVVGSAVTEPGANDAFFASVTTSGKVSNFGLSNAMYVFAKISDTNFISQTVTDLTKFNRVSGVVGINNGTVSNVYASTVSFGGASADYDAGKTIKTIGSGNSANANGYITDRAVVYATVELTGASVIMAGETLAQEIITDKGVVNGVKKWYSTTFGDRFNNSYMLAAAGGYRLSGLKMVSYSATLQQYEINSVADFLENATVYREGYALFNYANNTLSSTDLTNATVYVRIAKSLDFSNIGRYGYYPMVALGGTPHYVMYTGFGTANSEANKAGEPINKLVNGISEPDYENRVTLYKLPLNNYIEGLKGAVYRSYGMFAQFDAAVLRPISVYNINFINCNIDVANIVVGGQPTIITSAATVVGHSFRTVDLRSVSTNSKVIAKNGDNAFSSNRFAGFVASFDNISGTAVNGKAEALAYKSRFENLVFVGELYQGSRKTAISINTASDNRFSTGGIVGYMDAAVISSTSANGNINYENIYVGGSITGFKGIGSIGTAAIEPSNCVGGIVGFGTVASGSQSTGVKNFCVVANLTSSENDDSTVAGSTVKHPTYIGGIVGEQHAGNNTPSIILDSLSASTIKPKITLNTNPGKNLAQTNSNYFAGGIVGQAKWLTVTGTQLSPILSTDYFGSITVLHNANFSDADINIGVMAGRADQINLSYINNTANLNFDGRTRNLAIGGLVGVSNSTAIISIKNITSSANISVTAVGTTTARVAGLINVDAANTVTFEDCIVSGTVEATLSESLAQSNAIVGGLANVTQGNAIFTSCKTESTTVVSATVNNGKVSVAGMANFFGTATANGTFNNVTTNGAINFTASGTHSVTTVSGVATNAKENTGIFAVNNSKNYANITANSQISQNEPSNFTGISTNGIINKSENHGNITVTDTSSVTNSPEVGIYGIVAFGTVANCTNLGAIAVSAPNSSANRKILIGGLAGNTESKEVEGYHYTLGSSINGSATNAQVGKITTTNTGSASVFIGALGVTSPDVYSSYNYADISADGGAGSITIGGLLAHMPNGESNTYKVYSANYGNISATNFSGTVIIGGLLGSATTPINSTMNTAISQSYNHGSITAPNNTGSMIVGGIVGNAINGISIKDSISSANINVTGKTVVAGGIVGSINGIYGYAFTIDNVIATKSVTAVSGTTGIAGGIIGEFSLNGHIPTLRNLVNNGTVSGSTAAGGIIGSIKNSVTASGIPTNYDIKSVLNYGAVLASGGTAGGIIGIIGDTGSTQYTVVKIDGAAAYGSITATTSGGVVGAKNSGATLSLSNTVSYAVTNSNYGIIGASGGTASSLSMVIFVSNGTNKTVAPVLGTQTNVYIANSSNTDSISLATLYASNFILAPGANEIAYYGKANTEAPTLVWSEQPFKTASGYRSSTISDTATANAQKNVFALTTTGGRRQGMYLGEFSSSLISGSNSHMANALIAEIATLKQINYSRDTFDFSLDTDINDGRRIPLILSDNLKVQDEKRNLPTAGFVNNDFNPNTYITTIQPTSDYFLANSGEGSFVLDGSQIVLTSPQNFAGIFSNLANNTGLNLVESKLFDFNNISENPSLIATYKTMVYQGANLSGTLTGSQLEQWKAMYTQEYTFKIMYYDSKPSFMLSESTDYTPFIIENITEIGGTATGTISLVDGETDGNEISYTAKTASINNLSAAWVGSKITAIFTVSGFDQTYVSTNLSTKMFKKALDGTFKEFNYVNETDLTLKITYEHFQSTTIDSALPPVVSGRIKVELTITDREKLNEIASGTYKLSLSLPLDATNTFVRSIIFDKEASGDVFLHLQNNKLVTGTNDISLQLSDISKPYDNNVSYAYQADLNVNTLNPDGTRNFGHSKALDNPAALYQYSVYYGALPAFNKIGKTNPQALAIFNSLYKQGSNANVQAPTVTINRLQNGQQLGFTYAFKIIAENGNIGNYAFTYTYDDVQARPPPLMRLPPVSRNYTVDGVTSSEINNIEVSRIGTKSINVNYGGYENLTKAVKPITISTIDIYLKWNASQLVAEKVGYYDGETGLVVKTTTETSMKLPKIENVSNIVAKITIESDTTGGEYTFTNNYVYRYTAYTADSLVGEDDSKLPAYVTVLDTNGAKLTKLSLQPFTYAGHSIVVSKKDSRAAYLHELGFTSNLPEGGVLQGATSTGSMNDITTFSTAVTPNKKQANGTLDYSSAYVDAEKGDYFSNNRVNNFRIQVNFPAALAAGLSDYTTFVTLTLRGYAGSLAQSKLYNDEYATVYSVADGVETPLAKTTYYMLENGVPKIDPETGEKIVDYQTIEFFLPESSPVNLRVRAGNTLYFNDYTFISKGTLKNKTFNVVVNASETLKEQNIIVAIKMETEDKVNLGSYLTLKSNNLLFRTYNSGGFFDATLENGIFSKNYNNTNNTAGRYRIEIINGAVGISAIIESIAVEVGINDENHLVYDKNLDPNVFEVKTEDTLTIKIVIKLVGMLDPPWGDKV